MPRVAGGIGTITSAMIPNPYTPPSGSWGIVGDLTVVDITASGRIVTDDTTAATTTTDGSLQTDGGLSVAGATITGGLLTIAGALSGATTSLMQQPPQPERVRPMAGSRVHSLSMRAVGLPPMTQRRPRRPRTVRSKLTAASVWLAIRSPAGCSLSRARLVV